MPSLLHELNATLAAHPSLVALAETVVAQPGARRVAPLIAAVRSPFVAALARRLHVPLLYILSSSDAALRCAEDLRQWLDPAAVLLYPAGDTMPYELTAPGSSILAARLSLLQTLATRSQQHETTPLVIVAPVKALLQPTLSPADLAEHMLILKRGQLLRQDHLLRTLVMSGYRMVPSVEAPGELVRRGDLIDLWPMADAQPLRIEFFGDEIDNLRQFDPMTQRTTVRLDRVMIGPSSEMPLWRSAEAHARLNALDLSMLRVEARDEWRALVTRLEQGERFESQAFAGLFAPTTAQATLLQHLPPRAIVLFSEAQFLAQHAATIHEHAEEQRLRLLEAGELPEAFPRPYLCWNELWPIDTAFHLLDLSNNPPTAGFEDRFLPYELPNLHVEPLELFGGQLRRLVTTIVSRLTQGEQVMIVSSQDVRIHELIEERLCEAYAADQLPALLAQLRLQHGVLDGGWRLADPAISLYTDVEIFGLRRRRPLGERRMQAVSSIDRAAFVRGLKPGDYVVHIEHGIALYDGMIRRTVGEIEREYLVLRYAAGDKIYVPVDQVDRVTRYIGAGDTSPTLTRLGTQEWERAKRKARAAVQDMAEELLKLYAQRHMKRGHAFSGDGEWQRELETAFPFIETDDQLRAIGEVKADMEQSVPMDRLICGDVGFGKTEVALRAAFKAVQDGKQVAVLVPTTVLAQQHFDTFSKRMTPFPVTVQMLSRFRSPTEQEAIITALARGKVDILIGTHRLLSKDVHFRDLGLVVVDEEQRFGVRHKERLKQLRAEVDVLTLTATPIPRTLHMAMAGIRDLSVIDTPPEDRLPIKTYVLPYSDQLVREAVERELDREGQVYFVHNRVQSIYHVANRLRGLLPNARIAVGHGQMGERELERVMLDFFEGRYDILICTTIIESGLDVPNANTIIIDDAPNYGLAQLYQLRGRVGRSSNRAYAYLLYKQEAPMSAEAQARLEAIQEATELGAGFRVAMRDLEIRGAGNLLGAEQSGHIAAVGFDLYTRLLEQAVSQLKAGVDQQQEAQVPLAAEQIQSALSEAVGKLVINEKVLLSPLVTLDLPLTAYLPVDYIADERVRLGMYQRMVEAQTVAEVRALRQEIEDRFGTPPEEALHLLTWLQIKALALRAHVSSVVTTDDEFVIRQPVMDQMARERLRRRFGRDATVRIGPQFVRLNRQALGANWVEKLTNLLELLGT